MAILIDDKTKVLVQGITGRQGRLHTQFMKKYGTKIVAGVTPGKGFTEVDGIPIYDTVKEAVENHKIDASIIFVPPASVLDAAFEAISAGIQLLVIITEHVPVHDSIKIKEYAEKNNVTVIGPNTPGVISPGKSKLGIMPAELFSEGVIGIVARSGTLTHETAANLTKYGLGQSTAVGIGGDPVVGTGFVGILELFEKDPETKAIVLLGEIGGNAEEKAAEYIREYVTKPVVGFIAGITAPPGKKMGHAGAIINGGLGTAKSKIAALEKAGVKIAKSPSQIPIILKEIL